MPNKAKIHARFSKQHLIRQGMNISPLVRSAMSNSRPRVMLLWYCGLTKEVCEKSAIWLVLKTFCGHPFNLLCSYIEKYVKDEDVEIFSLLSWYLWKARNSFVHEGRIIDSFTIICQAGELAGDFLLCNGFDGKKIHNDSVPHQEVAEATISYNQN